MSLLTEIPLPLKPFQRSAWIPITQEGDGAQDASKFAGTPWLSAAEVWPTCKTPMQLFVQLNLQTLPPELGDRLGTGLLQLFYCTNNNEVICERDCEGWAPFSSIHLARLIPIQGEPHTLEPKSVIGFPAQQIIGWEMTDDYPGWSEALEGDLPLSLSDDEWTRLGESFPRSGDKLAGWPHWVQGVEYPNCPICEAPMELVLQLDSNDHLPYMFGDVGCGHITQCPTHKDQLGFGWACC
jgi:Domain of unknown function (DUF1963)